MKRFFLIFTVFLLTFSLKVGHTQMQKEQLRFFEYGWGWNNFSSPAAPAGADVMFHPEGLFFPELTLMNERGEKAYLSDYKNRFIILNIWATWCAPCLKEMPALNRLKKDMASNLFDVVVVSPEQDKEFEIRKLFREMGIDELDVWVDKKGSVEHIEGVSGLPMTFLLDPFRKELFRITGPVDWDAPDVRKMIAHYVTLWQEKTPERVAKCKKEKETTMINSYTGECL